MRVEWRLRLQALARAQFMSLCNTSTGIAASVLARGKYDFPVFLSFLNYALLALFHFRPDMTWMGLLRCSVSSNAAGRWSLIPTYESVLNWAKDIQRTRYALYLLAASIDVLASVLVLTSFRYTSLLSVVLLDSFAIPCTMLLSYLFLRAEYRWIHYLGTLVCLLGLGCNILSDSVLTAETSSVKESELYGDVLCLIAFSLYSVGNVIQEYLVKYVNREEYLGMLGFWGASISLVLCAGTEMRSIASLQTADLATFLLIAGYVFMLFLFYVNASIVIEKNDATYFNLSLLTSDLYALLFAYFVFRSSIHWLYFVALTLVVLGLIIYHSIDSPTSRSTAEDDPAVNSTTSQRRNGHTVVYEEVLNGVEDSEAGK